MVGQAKSTSRWRSAEFASIGVFLAIAAVLIALRVTWASAGPTTHPDPAIDAQAFDMPNQGWAPLTVYFSAFGTHDPNGTIIRHQWDLDGNGSYETDATESNGYTSHTYAKAGLYTIGLRVTSDSGGTATTSVDLLVRHPASSSVDYATVFDDTTVRRVDLIVSQANWDLMWAEPAAKTRVRADVVLFGERVDDVGLSLKGNKLDFPSENEKRPLKIDTNFFVPGQEYRNLKQLLLHDNFADPAMLREKLGYDMMRFAGRPASHVAYVEVYVDISDDELPPIYWGIYTLVERVDRKFIANRYGRDQAGGNLYKAYAWFEQGGVDLAYYGPDIADYPMPLGETAYRLRTNRENPDYSGIIELTYAIDGIEYPTEEAFVNALENVLDVDAYLRWLAVNLTLLNLDTFPFTANNLFLYDNPATGLFEFLPWDMNSSWGHFGGEATFAPFREVAGIGPVSYAPLFPKVFEIDDYRRDFLAYVDLLIRHWFNGENVSALAKQYHDLIRPYLTKDTGDKAFFGEAPLYTVEAFETGRQQLIELTRARASYLRTVVTADAMKGT